MLSAPADGTVCKMFHRSNQMYILEILLFQLNPNSRFLMQNTKGGKTHQIKAVMNSQQICEGFKL